MFCNNGTPCDSLSVTAVGKTVGEGLVEVAVRATGEKSTVAIDAAIGEMRRAIDAAMAAAKPKQPVCI